MAFLANEVHKNQYPEFQFLSLLTKDGLKISDSEIQTITLSDGSTYIG